MTLYTNFIISFLIIYFNSILTLRNPRLVIANAGLDTVFPSATGLVFVIDVNNTDNDDYDVELTADRCCLTIGEEINCDLLEIIGSSVERIPRGTTKTMKLIAPILDPFERVGHCIFHLDSKSTSRRRKTMRNKIKIDFDTSLHNKDQSMVIPLNVKRCNEVDEDPLNDCKLVDCDTYYNGKKSYFNRKKRKCTEVPECLSDSTVLAVYDSASNKCIEDVLKKEDVDFVKHLLENKERHPKDILIIKSVQGPNSKPNYDAITYNENRKPSTACPQSDAKCTDSNQDNSLEEINEITQTKKADINNEDLTESTDTTTFKIDEDIIIAPESALNFNCINDMFKNCTVNVLGAIVLIQCCGIFTMICFLPRSCTCPKKKIINKFFNYREDASVTTPLIDTSNISTETTNFTSESNIDKKIKCYKACQREVDVKVSLSDDILSKCVTRRDWHSKPLKYAPRVHKTNTDICKIQEKSENEDEIELISQKLEKIPEGKSNFQEKPTTESEEREKKSALCKSIFQKLGTKSDSDEKVPKCDSSEKEIKSHIYTDEKTKFSYDTAGSIKDCEVYNAGECHKQTYSMSTEKAAQAEFSNDSIDDFLSERGMIYLAGDDLSKYSLSSSSHLKNSSQSSTSSKTSKNNIVKNVLSIFRRNSKVGALSDPGTKKSGLNMEVLHMSHASIYSSSNNGSEYFKCLQRAKDSRTSL